MDEGFVISVEEALKLFRQKRFELLGKHELSNQLLLLLGKKYRAKGDALSVGCGMAEIFEEIIETMKCDELKDGKINPEWENYIVLSEFYLKGKTVDNLIKKLPYRRTKYFKDKVRERAIYSFSQKLYERIQEAKNAINVVHNLDRFGYYYSRFVPRRDKDGNDYVENILRILAEEKGRIVTLSGEPGVGKTSIAYKVAEECVERGLFEVVIWTSVQQEMLWVPERVVLRPDHITSFDGILDTIATTLGRRDLLGEYGETKQNSIAEILSEKPHLIIIDHIDSLTEYDEEKIFNFIQYQILLPSKVILTSRTKHIIGESSIFVSGMNEKEALEFLRNEIETWPVPVLKELEGQEAKLKLIWERTGGNPSVIKWCIGLMAKYGCTVEDAITLTLEKPELYSQELHKYLFNKAYNSLSNGHKRILHTMTIFDDHALPDAIGSASNVTPVSLYLGDLYEMGLISRFSYNRYRISPILRSFLLMQQRRNEVIGKKPSKEFIAESHQNLAKYYINSLRAMDYRQKFSFLKFEKTNVCLTMEWCYRTKKWDLLVDLMLQMGRPLGILGYSNRRVFWAKKAIEACDRAIPPRLEDKAWIEVHDIGWTLIRMGKVQEGKEIIKKNLHLAQEKGYKRVEALALRDLARFKKPEEAIPDLEKSLAIWRELEDAEWFAHTIATLGDMKYKQGKLEEAQKFKEKALEIRMQLGHDDGIIDALSELALIAFDLGDTEKSLKLSEESLKRAQRIEPPAPPYAYAKFCRARIEKNKGNYDVAIKLAQEALKIYENAGTWFWVEEVKRWLEELNPHFAL